MVHFAAPASGGGPLATIEQVCQANAQIFLTRDEILAYQLPNKLSHMTKLKNNQLLALPLAINLETQSNAQRRSDRKRTGQQKRKGSPIGDIRQLVVGVGQVMKICGIYEDVLPLMSAEAAGTNQSNQFPLFNNQQGTHPTQRQDKLDLAHRLHYASNGFPVKLSRDNLQARKQRKWQEQTYGRAYPTPAPLIYAGADTSGGGPILRGQRYARCILLSSNSVDALTDCTSQQVPSPKGSTNQESAQQPEVEVLVPVNQRGRFYICADKQAVLNELRCRHNSCHAPNPSLVFRLNQIVSLLNLSKRLSLEGSRQGGPVKLPLTVSLVLGARPANFSPSMFASSSLVQENRLESESNVAGHALACSYNRNNASPQQTSFAPCTCARQSSNGTGSGGGGLFSAVIRIEQVARRDVLLACTIKQRPLTQLSRPADLESKLASRFRRELPAHNGTLTESASKTICSGKASFSRLKACRSLLSMNGRRKKQRPNIPSSMLTETDGWNLSLASGTQNGSCGSQQRALDLVLDASRCQPTEEEEEEAEGQIVMIEFDCANEQLSFVRTFVESSLPTASIPDLVLGRMDFCHRNSLEWERQLKLSYASLSQNFELCRRQLAAAATNTLASSLVSWPPNQPSQPISVGTNSSSSPREDELTSTGSSRSTRSSSGVSSSEGRARDKPPEVVEAASSRHDQQSSRLLRLVHRMLPSKSFTEDTGNSPETIATLMNAQKIHRKLAQRRQSALSIAGNLVELQKRSSKTPIERDLPDQSESGSHLYESLERLNVRLDRQRRLANEVAAAHRVAPGLVAARSDNCLPGPTQSLVGSDGSSGESSSFASLSKANAENPSFSSNDDWWNATVSGEARQSELEELEERRSIRARRNHHQLMFLDDDTVGLEPVSIEACEGEHGDADREEPHLLSGGVGAYANLEEVERAGEPTTSRMERKLLKIRRQRRLGPGKGFYKASESDGGGTFTRNTPAEMELGTRADSVNSLASAFERWPGAAGSATNRSSSSGRKSPSLDSPSVSSFSSSTETNSSQTTSECSLSLASSSEFGRMEGRRRQLINWKPRIPFKASTGRPGLPVGQVTGGPAGSGVGQSSKLATLDRC